MKYCEKEPPELSQKEFAALLSRLSKKEQQDLFQIVKNASLQLVRDGHIDVSGKSTEEIECEIRTYLKKVVADRESPIHIVIDHTAHLLKLARQFAIQKKHEDACLYYALWFEHWLNHLIVSSGRRKGLTDQELNQIIRETDIGRGKTTWLLRLLDVPAFSQEHQKKILKIAELRNTFVHYKWKSFDHHATKEHQEALADIEKTVKYFKGFERRHFFGKMKSLVRKALTNKAE